ncbi:MAG: response regulator [Anaerolineae bacterium]|nr:response regulator [Anaerolineae bacterium]
MKKILVADDNFCNRELLVDLLKRFDTALVATLVAANGTEALEIAKKEHPDLILLDINMPGKSGVEVCQAVKSNPTTKNTYIIIVTANIQAEKRMEAKTVGADAYITKPFDVRQVSEMVKEALDL